MRADEFVDQYNDLAKEKGIARIAKDYYYFGHVYREDYQAVLSMVSVMLMDPAGFTAEEYKQIKEAIRKAGNKRD